jgi:hypothetical protein
LRVGENLPCIEEVFKKKTFKKYFVSVICLPFVTLLLADFLAIFFSHCGICLQIKDMTQREGGVDSGGGGTRRLIIAPRQCREQPVHPQLVQRPLHAIQKV